MPSRKDRKLLEPLFLKVATQNGSLAQGMYRFVSRSKLEELAGSDSMARFTEWAIDVLKETVRIGIAM